MTTHSGVEGLSGPCRGRVPKTVLKVSATRCCKLPDRGVVNDHKARESHGQKISCQQKCYIVELDRTCDEQLDGC